jgi:serine/threonine protein kinase
MPGFTTQRIAVPPDPSENDRYVYDITFKFRQRLTEGERCSIEESLAACPRRLRKKLFRRLLSAELEHKERAKGLASEYEGRFPQYRQIIKSAITKQTILCSLLDFIPADSFSEITGRFSFRRRLGKGSFGYVLLALDFELKRDVAIKFIEPRLCQHPLLLGLFEAEARAQAKLNHPSIVQIYQLLRDAHGRPMAIVMEYVPGKSLAHQLDKRQQREKPEYIAKIIAEIARTLAHAHRRGREVVHCDLKPANILVDKLGRPHVLDFGFAVHRMSSRSQSALGGTPEYMSPEQFLGKGLSGGSDIWSLGVIMYQMLTGTLPFRGTQDQLRDAVLNRDPEPPRGPDPDLPEELERICLRCLNKKRSERFSSAEDIATELLKWLKYGDSIATLRNYARTIQQRFSMLRTASGACVSCEQLVPMRLVPIERNGSKSKSQPEKTRSLFLDSVINELKSLQIVGTSGAGKTMALAKLAWLTARNWLEVRKSKRKRLAPVPVYIDLETFTGGDLLSRAVVELEVSKVPCDTALVGKWLQKGMCILLLDAIDHSPAGLRCVVASLNHLRHQFAGVRFVLTTSHSDNKMVDVPRFALDRLTDSELRRILCSQMGEGRAQEIIARLRNWEVVDTFRLPILAWFLAKANIDPRREIETHPALLYGRIIHDRLSHSPLFGHPGRTVEQALTILSELGNGMWKVGRTSIADDPRSLSQLSLLVPELHALIDALVEVDVLLHRFSELKFVHDSFRDYFAASWLCAHGEARGRGWVWRKESRYVAQFVVGLASEQDVEALLGTLYQGVRWPLFILRRFPLKWIANRLFLLLWCLSETRGTHAALKDRILCMLGTKALHLESTSNRLVQRFDHCSRFESVYTTFLVLIARFRVPEVYPFIASWLRSNPRKYVVRRGAVYAQLPPEEGSQALFRDLANNVVDISLDSLSYIPNALFEWPASKVVPLIANFVSTSDPHVASKFLLSLFSASFETQGRMAERLLQSPPSMESVLWVDWLCEVIVDHHNADVRLAGVRIIRMFTESGRLPSRAAKAIIATLDDSDPKRRIGAILALPYADNLMAPSAIKGLSKLVSQAGDLSESWLALSVIEELGTEAFAAECLVFLTRFLSPEDMSLVEIQRVQLSARGDVQVVKEAPTLAILMIAFDRDEKSIVRRWCVKLMARIECAMATDWLRRVYEDRSIVSEVRAEAFKALLGQPLNEEERCNYLLNGLHDDELGVQRHAAFAISLSNIEVIKRFVWQLKPLAESEMYDAPSCFARDALRKVQLLHEVRTPEGTKWKVSER